MSNPLIAPRGLDDPSRDLPKGWLASQLATKCEIFGGGRLGLTKEKDYRSSGVTAFSAAGPDGHVDVVEIDGQDGVVLSAIGANCGRCFFASGRWTTLANVQAIIPKTDLDAKYLFYYVSRDGYWTRSGSAQPFIKPSSIQTSWVAYPPSNPEQSKIAEVLSTVDRAIAQTEALIAKQQRIKTGLMQDLLTRGIDEHGQLRSEATHTFKDSPLGRIPVEWDCDPLGTHIWSIEQGWSPDCEAERAAFGYWGVLKTTAVTWEGYQDIENKALPESLKPRTQFEVHTDDVLMTRAGPNSRVGVVAHVRATQPKLMLSDKLYRLRNKNSVDPEYLALTLASAWTQRHLSTLKTGLAESQTNISQDIVRSMLIKIPKRDEQIRIVSALRGMDHQLVGERVVHKKLQSLKTALMQDLLTGKVRVTPLLQPAETASA
ncbi:MAG TPA: restriction endonuclease subunit S [Nevskiaceae bacterium]|nr:restriction endonuclease subunit S [Nevskiaceae bacterium]